MRVDQIHVDFTRIFHSGAHGFWRNLVKLDTHFVALHSQRVFQMPRYSFSLTIGVGCEMNFVVLFDCLRELFYGCFLVRRDDILRFETVVHVDAQRARRQIANVAFGRKHRGVVTQIFLDGLCLVR